MNAVQDPLASEMRPGTVRAMELADVVLSAGASGRVTAVPAAAAPASAVRAGDTALVDAVPTGDGAPSGPVDSWHTTVTGISIDSRDVCPGDLYIALPGASRHGAEFVRQAVAAGASAVLTDAEGIRSTSGAAGVPLFVAENVRALVGALSATVYGTAIDGAPTLFGVTGTNGKTTTTYFINSLLRTLGRTTGLIGTIEILAGGKPIASTLTTPESPQIHGLLALMRERGIEATSMEVSSHALSFSRVAGVCFDVAGFTNLTQDHLDLHGSMEEYFDVKAALFRAGSARSAVITVDDEWGWRMATRAGVPVTTLLTRPTTGPAAGVTSGLAAPVADWTVQNIVRDGLGHSFRLESAGGQCLSVRTGLPGLFNVSNAALAAVMVAATGVDIRTLNDALDRGDPFTIAVPGRMQLISESPAAIVDFAHNPDALALTLAAVRRPEPDSRVIVVFGATGERDTAKRSIMGGIAASLADVVIVTDDDPHGEDEATIRAQVLDGARQARASSYLHCRIEEVHPRAAAIDRAVELARPQDAVLIAGRGHEVWQEVKGVNVALDDRRELRRALSARGFTLAATNAVES